MKTKMSKTIKRVLALLLCMAMMMDGGLSVLASEVAGLAEVASIETEHVHTEACYTKQKVSEDLICGKEVVEGHVHGDACYEVTTSQELVCGQEEIEGHSHGDSCVETTKELSCEKEETEEHSHDDSCYTEETKNVCGQEEFQGHTHDEGCYTTIENKNLVCTLEECEGHAHSDDCYAWEDVLTCTITEAAPVVEEPVVCEVCGADPCTCVPEVAVCEVCGLSEEECTCEEVLCEVCGLNEEECTCEEVLCEVCGLNEEECTCEEVLCEVCGLNEEECTCEEVLCEVCGLNEEECTCEEVLCEVCGLNEEECTCEEVLCEVCGLNEEECTCEAEPVVLTAEVDGMVITLSGPASSFDAEKTYSMLATKIEAEGLIEAVATEETATEEVVTETAAEEIVAETATEEVVAETATEEVVTETAAEEIVAEEIETEETISEEAVLPSAEINAEEVFEVIEEAMEEVAEEKQAEVQKYQAFDIRLFANGEEVQPLGPVEVKFSSKQVAESVKDEDIEVAVYHVDETTGEVNDMNATTADGDVAIETDHFSIYVVVDTELTAPSILVDVEHYGKIQTIPTWVKDGKLYATKESGTSKSTNPFVIRKSNGAYYTYDEVYDRTNHSIKTVEYEGMLYKTDEQLILPNLYRTSVEDLSKVLLATAKKGDGYKNYLVETIEIKELDKVVIIDEDENKVTYGYEEDQKELEKIILVYDEDSDTYSVEVEYVEGGSSKKDSYDSEIGITLSDTATIRFNYVETTASTDWKEDVVFFDHNITNGNGYVHDGDGAGSNSPTNFATTNTNLPKMAVGQWVSGNQASWNLNMNAYNDATAAKTFLNNVGFLNVCGGYGSNQTNRYYTWGYRAKTFSYLSKLDGITQFNTGMEIRKGLTKDTIGHTTNADGKKSYILEWNAGLQQPGFFEDGKKGTLVLKDFDLGFEQTGDTYILKSVYRGDTKVNQRLNGIGGNDDYTRIREIHTKDNEGDTIITFSNNFWPLDCVTSADYAGKNYGMDKRGNQSEIAAMAVNPGLSDDGTAGVHNWHFGMRYEFTFKIGDYVGPMNYYFRGDDDFFMYIDGKKVIDIGGIHSAAGQAVDVRDWLENNYSGHLNDPDYEYTVSIFYMERGGYGSCCYMQYTLPNCEQVKIPTVPDNTKMTVEKRWLADEEYVAAIDVDLLMKSSKTGSEVVLATATLNEENNWTHTWDYLSLRNPSDTSDTYTYRVVEKESSMTDGITVLYEAGATNTIINNVQPIDIPVEKVWEDDEDLNQLRPDSIEVKLLADGNPAKHVDGTDVANLELSASETEAENWKGIWENLPKYRWDSAANAKAAIVYTVEEVNVPAGYKVEYDVTKNDEDVDLNPGDENFGFIVTNTLEYGKIKIVKTLPRYNETLGEVTFVFKIEQKKDSEVIFSDVISITFDGPGVQSYEYPKEFPAETEVIVTEVYSGASYKLTTDRVVTKEIVANEVVEAAFTNDYVDGRLNSGTGLVNEFSYIVDGENKKWVCAQEAAILPPTGSGDDESEGDNPEDSEAEN